MGSNLDFNWREDLLSAADSVTDAMSSLVLEYNADTDEEDSARAFENGQPGSNGNKNND